MNFLNLTHRTSKIKTFDSKDMKMPTKVSFHMFDYLVESFCFVDVMFMQYWRFSNLGNSKCIQQYTVIDWVRGQQQFCLTRGWICCPKPQAEGNRSVRVSIITAVVREASL